MNNITTWNSIEVFFSHKNGGNCFRKKICCQKTNLGGENSRVESDLKHTNGI